MIFDILKVPEFADPRRDCPRVDPTVWTPAEPFPLPTEVFCPVALATSGEPLSVLLDFLSSKISDQLFYNKLGTAMTAQV